MSRYKGYIAALLAAIFFGIGTTVNKIVLTDIHPLVIASTTYLFAGITLAILRFTPFFKKLLENF